MVAAIYSLDDTRSRRLTPTNTVVTLYSRLMADGLAATLSAQSFCIQYAVALHRFHASVLNAGYSPSLRKPSNEVVPFRW